MNKETMTKPGQIRWGRKSYVNHLHRIVKFNLMNGRRHSSSRYASS